MQADAGGVGTPELTSPRLHLAPGRADFPHVRTGRVCLGPVRRPGCLAALRPFGWPGRAPAMRRRGTAR